MGDKLTTSKLTTSRVTETPYQQAGRLENIKKVRTKLGLTQDDLVRKSGVKHTTLTKIENNVVIKPSVQTVAKIVKCS